MMAQIKHGKLTQKDIKILRILKSNPEGLRAKTIRKLLNLSPRTLYNHLSKLNRLNLINNILPIWKLCHNSARSLKLAKLLESDNIQSHKFSFILRLINKPNWWNKRNNQLIKLKDYHFKPVKWRNNRYEQLTKDNFLIQFFSNSIVFINKQNYLGPDAYSCFIDALTDTLEELRFIEERFNFQFFLDTIPQLSVKTHHYVNLKDELAKKYRKNRKGYELMIDGVLRAWIDMSEPIGLEFGSRN